MRRACVVLLAGCGFQSQPAGQTADANPAIDAPVATIDAPVTTIDASIDGGSIPSGACWRLESVSENVHMSGCPPIVAESFDITGDVSIDTSTGVSTPAGFRCALITDGPDDICALSAKTITLAMGATLSAHGDRPLALFAHDIDLQGRIDVASHFGQPRGPGATPNGCNNARGATKSGGGAGGGFNHPGGAGGDQGGQPMTGAAATATIGVKSLRGGCDGTGGGDGSSDGGPPGAGGGAGGAVWIAADTGTLTIGNAVIINASGAGGAPGATSSHGGSGGGSGGLIVLQAPTIVRTSTTSQIFAAGGGGGGGAIDSATGQAGSDPTRSGPMGGLGGAGAAGGSPPRAGTGGDGDPSPMHNGEPGDENDGGGGGGGGGGSVGLVWVVSATILSNTNIDPDPLRIGP